MQYMICTIRIPDVLQNRIDMAAGDNGRSQWILEACRMRLDLGSDLVERAHLAQGEPKPDMQSLRDICVGNIRRTPEVLVRPEFSAQPASPEIAICGKTWWEDGENYECLMDKGHKALKCGQRGMVRNITE
jgi:hypothetical protein